MNSIKEIAEKYNWLKYEQVPVPEEHLWIVLRWYLNQYVVHVYNCQDGGHYFGQYFDSKEQAEIAYQAKLAYYSPQSLAQKLADEMGWQVIID
jgi:hypothetical protein